LTTHGLEKKDFKKIAEIINEILQNPQTKNKQKKVREILEKIANKKII
jgi:glycine/serine hydroxymethyltransferase